jgi:protein-S-isoprenylcysteine O-methyltransferase Ste14
VSRIEPLPLLLSFLAWPALGVGMVLFRRRGSGPVARRDPLSLVGLLVQCLAFGLGFSIRRPPDPDLPLWEEALRWLGVVLAWGSAAVAIAAVRTLGRQWSLEARVLEGHRLIVEGPYRHVRHPIYAAMLGLCVGTGLNLTPWGVLAAAVVLYLVGTRLRTRAEEGLLLRQFGEEYVRYAEEVPALLPRPFRSSRGRSRGGTTSAP